MSTFRHLLVLQLFLLLLSNSLAVRGENRLCRQVCRRMQYQAHRDCHSANVPRRFCQVRPCEAVCRKCKTKRKFTGWRCEPKPSKTPTPTPTSSTSPPPTPTPSQSSSPPEPTADPGAPLPGRSASIYTDPHVRTYDGLLYDCMASGEFTLVKSLDSPFEVQTRFGGEDTTGSVTKGVVTNFGTAPVVQFSMAVNTDSPYTSIQGCPVLFYVDGTSQDVLTGSGQDSAVKVSASASGSISVLYPNALEISFSVQTSSFFGCYFESVNVFIPETFVENNKIVGILGSPNGNVRDEWMNPSGETIPGPITQEDRLFEKAYNYCTNNWCVKNAANSLFKYEAGSSHASFNNCDVPYPIPPDLSSVSSALETLCGADTACLIDGIVGGIEDAENALTVQADVDRRSSISLPFRFRPVLFQVGEAVNVKITLDASSNDADVLSGLQRFNVYRANSNSGVPGSELLVVLEDNGQALTSDDVAGDLIFTNVLAVESEKAGEVLAFVAFPVISGSEDRSSPLTATALNAVRSYSRESGVSSEEDTADSVSASVESLDGLELVASYSWPRDEADLDTGTQFLGSAVGYECGESPYMTFSGDNTDTGGTETIVVKLREARAAGKWSDQTKIVFRAGWHSRMGGPATLRMALQNQATGREVPGTGLATVIVPGSQEDCASKEVAELSVKVADRVTLSLTIPGSS